MGCCSGIFDLKGSRLSSRREYVAFDDETEESLSPIRHLDQLRCPVTLVCASFDSPEFQRQTREFADALRQGRLLSQLTVGEGYNHFELIETLAAPYGVVGRLALDQMNLAR